MEILGYYPEWQNRKCIRIGTYSILVYFICFGFGLIFKMHVILSFVVILILWERGQNKGFSGYWLKDMLILEKCFVIVFLEKTMSVYASSREMWMIFDRGRPTENYIPENQTKRLS